MAAAYEDDNTKQEHLDISLERVHFFVTNMECSIHPKNYDQIRKQEKAEMPSTKILFIPDPSEAVTPPDDRVPRKRFGAKSSKGNKNAPPAENGDNAPGAPSKKNAVRIPSTSATKETMRPAWKNEHVYFALQTHTELGRPIDFTGAHLHISLFDAKNGLVIGSHCLNLAHLLIVSRERGVAASQNKRGGPGNIGPRRSLAEERSRRSIIHDSRGGKASKRGTNNNSARNVAAPAPRRNNYQLIPKPSAALRSASVARKTAATLPPAVQRAIETLNRSGRGSSKKLFESIVADLGGDELSRESSSAKKNTKKRREDSVLQSLKISETLIEGGLVTGHLKCDIDIWWT